MGFTSPIRMTLLVHSTPVSRNDPKSFREGEGKKLIKKQSAESSCLWMKEKNQAPVSESTSFSPFPDMSEMYIGPNSSISYGWRGWDGKWTAGRTEEKSLPPRREGSCFQQG